MHIRNFVYVITCYGCGDLCIGKTRNTLRVRIRIHKQHIILPEYRTTKIQRASGRMWIKILLFSYFIKCASLIKSNVEKKGKHFVRTYKHKLNSLLFHPCTIFMVVLYYIVFIYLI